ncbi:hypothetical protein ACF0H5_012383 [Mactra antiquata]
MRTQNITFCDNETFSNSCMIEKKHPTPSYEFTSQVSYTIVLVITFIIGILGNTLVIFVVCLNRNMKTSVNIYLINLCIADILVLAVCMPTVVVDIYAREVWYFGSAMCSIVPFLENTVVHASVLTLIAISIERYRVICQPLRGIRDDVLKNAKAVPLIWMICAASNIPWFFIADYRDSSHTDGTPIKVCRLKMSPDWHRLYVAILCICYFVVPFLILLILYCRICYILQISNHDITSGELRKDSKQSRYRHRLRAQVVNIIVCLVLLFFMFHLPYRIISMWFTFGDQRAIHSLGLHKLFHIIYSVRILFYFNHAVNPIIYNFVSSKFRNALRCLITKRKYRGSLMSSNRRGNYNTPFTRPKHSHHLFTEREYDVKCMSSSPGRSSSSLRRNINEFYPMYANIIQRHDGDRYTNGKISNGHHPLHNSSSHSGE